MAKGTTDDLSPLASHVRAQRADRYLSTLFAPPECRASLLALYAFDHEIARVRSIVREPVAGLIRLQWWQDVIEGLERGETVAHPVARGLQHAVAEDGLDTTYLKRAIDGRRRPLEDDALPDLASFENYLLDIGGSVTSAAATLLGAVEPNVQALANRIGLIVAAWEEYRFLDQTSHDRQPWLPAIWLHPGSNQSGDHAARDPGPGRRLSDWALAKLAESRGRGVKITRPALPAFFPGTLAGIRLYRSGRSGRQPTLPAAPLGLVWYWLRGVF